MRTIDMQTWSRREHYNRFVTYDHPHFNMCANVDLTTFYPVLKQHGISFNIATVYILTRAANAIPEFRYRIRAGKVIEHEIVHPGSTILTNEDLFTFCFFDYIEDFLVFASRATETIAYVKEHPTLAGKPGRDDLLFMTAIPWVSFTSFMHPMHLNPADSVPRFAWGKFFEEGEFLKMPLSVQGHHALMDGVHMGKYYTEVQDYLDHPAGVLDLT
jgi:chloramphenicol O-acetyltransferase type A